MSFVESPRFPDDIAYNAQSGPMYSTDVVAVASGFEKRNQNWSAARLRFDVGFTRTQAQLDALVAFFHAMKGRALGFRIKDHSDYSATAADGRIGTAVGDGTPGPHQLRKRYTSGSNTTDRDITKPVSVAVYRDGVLKTLTTHYTLDITTGEVTWVHDATANASSITVGASTQVVLPTNPGTLTAGQKLYLSGFTGADSALVNGLAHTINSVTGSGPYTFTLATNTSGKTITLGSGVGRKYPQASEALTWAGEFDVPARFDTDELRYQMLESGPGRRMYQLASVPVVEIKI